MVDRHPLLNLVDELAKIDWSRKTSWLTGTLINLIGVSLLAALLTQLGVHLAASSYLILLGLLELMVTGTFVYNRWLRVFDPKTISIGFAIQPDAESRPFYDEVRAEFSRYVQDQQLSGIVRIRALPSDLKFDSDKKAEKYILDKGLRVVLWGDTTPATVGGSKVSVFNLRFSCQYAPIANGPYADVVSTLKDGSTRNVWGILSTDSLLGMKVVAANVIEISVYVLAVCLLSVRQLDHAKAAVAILENLRVKLEPQVQNPNFPDLNQLRSRIKHLLYREYRSLAVYYLEGGGYAEALTWSQKALVLEPRNFDMNVLAARICWEAGDRNGAYRHTNLAHIVGPKEVLPFLNFAFLYLMEGKYGKALAYYKRLNDKVYKTNILDVVDFLERQLEESGKLALEFAAGWVSSRYGDKGRGARLLESFIGKAGRAPELAKLVAEAKRELETK